MTEEWGPWTLHDDTGLPLGVTPEMVVQAEMKGDGYILCPMLAKELDWHCPHDPVAAYRIRKPGALLDLIKIVEALPAQVSA